MDSRTRKILYIIVMPLLFALNIFFAFRGFNLNYGIYPILILVAIVRLSDREIIMGSISAWCKRKLAAVFPDINETGTMSNGRFLLVTLPLIMAAFVNIKILDLVG